MRKAAIVWLAAGALLLTSCSNADPPGAGEGTDTAGGAGGSPSATDTQTTTTPADTTPEGSGENSGDDGNGGSGGGGSDDAGSASCQVTEGWTLHPDVKDGNSGDPIREVRAGRHNCFDRVVIEVDGTAETGFDVAYQSQVLAPGSGTPVPVAGAAALRVIVRSPAQGYPGTGTTEPLATQGEHFIPESDLSGWGALRSVRNAGSFEGQTTFALGAREELPFRAFSHLDGSVREVVIDIAHSAS
ncbi:AMIN-like domain-containing (lipo)protein [Salinactinospora qingdaonensis]|uniref:AMIN-like domain-containing protein n=1 Tax=Salinactinospora qingdaonensis TaxID=702744 RepID=A0ABP7G9L5_9ACTN